MKGDPKVVGLLNEALCSELTAINQYVIHGRMRANWGYMKLARESHVESIEEMKHAERLIDRILFLEGVPNMQKYKPVRIGEDVKSQIESELEEELAAVKAYNASVIACREAGDNGSAELFKDLLLDEEGHVDHLEQQLELIAKIGMENYLAQNLGGGAAE